ncbi:MAG: GtrA family protein [Burkholderiaceae bacterium]
MVDSRVFRFLLAGIMNTIFGIAVYAGVERIGAPLWLALLVGMAAGVVFSFVTMGAYAFRDLSLKRLPRFIACYAANYMVNLLALHLLAPIVEDAIARQVLLTPLMAVFSYLCLSRFVFGPGRAAAQAPPTSDRRARTK